MSVTVESAPGARAAEAPDQVATRSARQVGLDWMRGVVMLIMTLDHASLFYNEGRVHSDSAATYGGEAIDPAQFFVRWVTHLCAPTFLFLAGAALALSVERRRAQGQRAGVIDRDLLIRGAFIVMLDLVWVSFLAQHHIFQVLYAIGASMLAMILLRRVPVAWLVGGALAWFALGELLTLAVWTPAPEGGSAATALVIGRYMDADTWILYPLVPWLAMMLLGWGFGHHFRRRGAASAMRLAFGVGLAALAVFLLLRGLNGYGNMALPRADGSLVQWLNVSKYPPSATFVSLELGLSLLVTGALIWLSARVRAGDHNPVLVFGQTALFFYVIHQAVLLGVGKVFGLDRGGIPETLSAMLIALVVLYPLCWLYRRAKRAHPESLLKYL